MRMQIIVFLSFAIGVFFTMSIVISSPTIEAGWASADAKKECEAPLPRDQKCKIIAIPEVTK